MLIKKKESGACRAASYGHHLPGWQVQAVQALAGVGEIIALDQDLFCLQPVQGVAHGPGRQGGLADEVLLRQLAAMFEHFVHELCRWRQVPDLPSVAILAGVYDKNDPS